MKQPSHQSSFRMTLEERITLLGKRSGKQVNFDADFLSLLMLKVNLFFDWVQPLFIHQNMSCLNDIMQPNPTPPQFCVWNEQQLPEDG